MKQTKHTPGPWKYRETTNMGTEHHGKKRFIIYVPEEATCSPIHSHISALRVIAETPYIDKYIDHEANARLIAAAPELLEALRMIVEVFNLDSYGADTGGGKCYAKAQIAIAKAEG